nr:unnamed protein product [Callosobruchus analis]
MGPEINDDLAVRWNSYLCQGLDKETWVKLLNSSLTSGNCTMLQGPKLNSEVQAMLSPFELKKDTFLHDLQGNLGKGLGILGYVITDILEKKSDDEVPPHLTKLVKAGQLLCSVHYELSWHRRLNSNRLFNNKIQKIASNQKIDSLLFGEDFGENSKLAKTLEALPRICALQNRLLQKTGETVPTERDGRQLGRPNREEGDIRESPNTDRGRAPGTAGGSIIQGNVNRGKICRPHCSFLCSMVKYNQK